MNKERTNRLWELMALKRKGPLSPENQTELEALTAERTKHCEEVQEKRASKGVATTDAIQAEAPTEK